MDWATDALGPIFGGLVVLLGAVFGVGRWLASRRDRKYDELSVLVDQLQEEVHSLRAEVAHLRAGQGVRDNYIADLRGHIYAGKLPPPPPWPAGLGLA